jgi:GH25 family lysozyme M1 (1,4-beta-N-acetylmuramidase)
VTIFLPDVSAHQRGLQLEPGTVAVLAKATEGSTFADPAYSGFKAQAAKVGAVFGAYHFLWSGTPAEAAWTFKHVGKTPLMVDAENPKVKTTVAMILSFVAEYRKLGGVVHLVYLPHWYWQELGSPDLTPLTKARLRLVSSSYATYSDSGPGWQPYGGVTPVQWQYTDQFGYGGQRVDFNAFRGTVEQYSNILRFGVLAQPVKTHPNVGAARRALQRAAQFNKTGRVSRAVRAALRTLRGIK